MNDASIRLTVHCPSPAYVNFEEYAQSFLPKPIYYSCPSRQFLSMIRDARYAMDTPTLGPQVSVQQLNWRNYAVHFRNMLIEERKSLGLDFKQYNLFEVPLLPVAGQHDMYRIDVPGLREDYTPAIFVGYSLSIRAIRWNVNIYGPKKRFDGTEYIGYVSQIDRINVPSPVRLLCHFEGY